MEVDALMVKRKKRVRFRIRSNYNEKSVIKRVETYSAPFPTGTVAPKNQDQNFFWKEVMVSERHIG